MSHTTVRAPSAGVAGAPCRRRRSGWMIALPVLIIAASAMSLAIGSRPMSADQLADAIGPALESLRTGSRGGSDGEIIANLRVPRTILALSVGAALGVAGAIIQGYTRNPLAEPGILGISAGAAFAVVAGTLLAGSLSTPATAALAFVGAAIAAFAVFGVTSFGGGLNPLTLIRAGAAITALLASLTSALVLSDVRALDRVRFWTVGSVAAGDLGVALTIAPILAIGILAGFATAPTLNLLALGDDVSAGLGVNVPMARIAAMVIVAVLAGASTAAAGPIGFVGLMVPHLVRSFTGPDHRWLLPASAAAGAALLTFADVVGRVIIPSGELEVGVVLAFVGAPFFIAVVRRRKLVTA